MQHDTNSNQSTNNKTHCVSVTFWLCRHTSFLIFVPTISIRQNILSISASWPTAQSSGCFSFQFSVFSRYHSGSGGGLLALKPMLLMSGDTAAAPSAVSSLRSTNLSRKRRRESKVDGDLAVGWLRGRSTVLKMAAVKRCDAEGEQARSDPPAHTHMHTAALVCLRTLSHALDTPGRQSKCGPASLSS